MGTLGILALEPYYGGSHRAFLDGWAGRSRHDWTLLTLRPRKWKWRMRHAAVTLAEEAGRRLARGGSFDLLFGSDMLNLAEFRGLAPPAVAALPAVLYFHENQLTYPVEHERDWDYHFAITNMTSALAADRAWFNSAFHRDAFLEALYAFLRRMPDHRPLSAVDRIRRRSRVRPPGVADPPPRPPRAPGPLRILWAARWEYDKNPELFFAALGELRDRGAAFRLSVLGESFRTAPSCFASARASFADRIDAWGYLPSRRDYEEVLARSDVFVSTADHEFFGIAAVEAARAGVFPLLPARLAYPEVFERDGAGEGFFYERGAEEIAGRLEAMAADVAAGRDLWGGDPDRGRRLTERFSWSRLAGAYDDELEAVAAGPEG